MQEDISDIPQSILRSLASIYRQQVYELRARAYHLWKAKGEEVWRQIKKGAEASDNRVEYWQQQLQLAVCALGSP